MPNGDGVVRWIRDRGYFGTSRAPAVRSVVTTSRCGLLDASVRTNQRCSSVAKISLVCRLRVEHDPVQPLDAVRLERRLEPVAAGAEDPVRATGELADRPHAVPGQDPGLARQAVEETPRRA